MLSGVTRMNGNIGLATRPESNNLPFLCLDTTAWEKLLLASSSCSLPHFTAGRDLISPSLNILISNGVVLAFSNGLA